MMRQRENLTPKGYLEIFKVYPNGKEELHWSDHNVITSGMSVGISTLFANITTYESVTTILDYQIRYFQLGVSGTSNYGVSTYQLVSSVPIGFLSANSLVPTVHNQMANRSIVQNQSFLTIAQSNIYKASPTSVRYHLIIPADSGNDILVPINEVGLFMKNPFGLSPVTSILVAYKQFSSILKTSEFALLFRWLIQF